MQNRVLIVEDDIIQQSLLQVALEQRGYVIDTATDGIDAIKLLQSRTYDVALFDYRLPDIDGLASARLTRFLIGDDVRPALVAMTADCAELEQRPGAQQTFDAFIAKPFDLLALVRLVEAQLTTRAPKTAMQDRWKDFGLARVPSAIVVPVLRQAQHELVASFFDLTGRFDPDIILLADSDGVAELEAMRSQGDYCHLPVIDLTGQYQEFSDASFSAYAKTEWEDVASVIIRYRERQQKISQRALFSQDIGIRMLAHIAQSGRPLTPHIDVGSKQCVRYNGFYSSRDVLNEGQRLHALGYVRRTFSNRFHVCSGCNSSRLSVREECTSCRSAELTTTPLLHHYRCAHQGLEAEFAAGRELVCPKCRQHLRHYGSDYDKPGDAIVCGACNAVHSDAAVGFICLDCGLNTDGDVIACRDVYKYDLTDEGFAVVAASRPQFTHLPSHLPAALADQIDRYAANAQPNNVISLVEIKYRARDAFVQEKGLNAFEQARQIFVDNLVGCSPVTIQRFPGPVSDFVLANAKTSALRDAVSCEAMSDAENALAKTLNPDVHFIDVDQWARYG